MIETRCSALPLTCICPASLDTDGMVFDDAGEAARLGTACHKWFAARVLGQEADTASLARRYDVNAEELGMLCGLTWKCWQQIEQHFPSPETEVAMEWSDGESLSLTGHADLLSIVES